jgi:hypothetical protein
MTGLGRLDSFQYTSDTLYNIKPDEIERSLICTICQEILKIPRECSNCHNNFCKKCIEKWLNEKNGTCPFRCPNKINLVPSHRIILDALRFLKFKCKNETNGCNFIMSYDNNIEHIGKCEYNFTKCTNSECNTELMIKDLNEHLDTICPLQPHKCKICSFETIGPNKVQHICKKIATENFIELKSELDNFMIKIKNKMSIIDEKLNYISS